MKSPFKINFESRKLYFWALYCLGVLPLILYFNWPFARDSAVYVSGFQSFLQGSNPYDGGIFRAGLLGSGFIYLLAMGIPLQLESAVFISLNILGTVFFVRHFLGGNYKKLDFLILTLTVWSSTSREGLSTIQITGIMLGLITVVFRSLNSDFRRSNSIGTKFLAVSCSVILLDLKPHFVLPLFIIILLREKCIEYAVAVMALMITGHMILDLWAGKFLTLEWLKLMMNLANQPINEGRKDLANLWSLIYSAIDLGSFSKLLPYLFIVITIVLTSYCKSISREESIYIGLALPLLSTYTHYYDYLGIVVLCLVSIARTSSFRKLFLATPLLLIAENWQDSQGILLIVLFMVACVFCVEGSNEYLNLKKFAQEILISFTFYLLIHLSQDFLVMQGANYMSLSATTTLILSTIIYFLCRRRSEIYPS